jgi:hypothetical protein
VVAAQRDERMAEVEQRGDGFLDRGEGGFGLLGEREITGVVNDAGAAEAAPSSVQGFVESQCSASRMRAGACAAPRR